MTWWKVWEKASGRGSTDYYEEGVVLVGQELYHEALTSFRLALKDRPDDPATLEHIAVIYTHIGLLDEAARSYHRALEFRPLSPAAHYGLAFLLLKDGEEEDAADHLRAFLEQARRDGEEARQIDHAERTLEKLSG